MTDYAEEQENEIEALLSIYPDELQVVSTKPYHSFRMLVSSQCSEDIENATCILQFMYTATYPDEIPEIEVLSFENIEQEDADVLLNSMKEEAEGLLGMVMIFTLVSTAQEKLTDLVELADRNEKEEKLRQRREIEDAERKKFEGTRVTIESFLAWKAKFDAELTTNTKKTSKKDTSKDALKLTGYELFMQDHSLDSSDVKFLEEEGEVVTVDESLFQDLDDLDLDEDFDDLEACGMDS